MKSYSGCTRLQPEAVIPNGALVEIPVPQDEGQGQPKATNEGGKQPV